MILISFLLLLLLLHHPITAAEKPKPSISDNQKTTAENNGQINRVKRGHVRQNSKVAPNIMNDIVQKQPTDKKIHDKK